MGSTRRAFIDWARGLAVIVMIEAHAMDAWTRAADRNTRAFADLTILGGFAAPLFLWLAGLGVVLSASRTAERTGSRMLAVDAACRRGLEIFLLAFLFRLQAFIVSPGGHPVTLFRVDVLNVMGPAIVAAGLAWALSDRAVWRVPFYGALAAGVAMLTPVVRAAPGVDLLPTWVQWYVRPAGDLTAFTLFPWAGFVFAGAAVGALMVAAPTADADRLVRLAIGIGGAALIVIGFYTAARPSIYSVPASFWTSSPTWFAARVGIMMVALAGMSAIPVQPASRWQRPLATLGRASLFVYWIHVELVYGYASWLWRHRLPVWASVGAWAVFTALMYRAVVVRDRYLARRSAEFIPRVTVSEA
ncbi:MAG TPA: acyltransferase [Vicinamibacterales bacterium]|nr:acyltransferase [Vicinamibacterales bacterium]